MLFMAWARFVPSHDRVRRSIPPERSGPTFFIRQKSSIWPSLPGKASFCKAASRISLPVSLP